ncbi:MAG: glycosyltransferase family 1 protein [Patescibacteria group bacterium]
MHIGVDLRSLLSPHRTGVGQYAAELLSAIFKIDSENQYYLFYNSLSKARPFPALSSAEARVQRPSLPPQRREPERGSSLVELERGLTNSNIHILSTRYPNKLFSASSKFLKIPKLDSFLARRFDIPRLDYFFSPHLNFTSLSGETKHILTIHDLTYELFPNFLTRKQRWWHRLTSPKEQCEDAHLILTPSENTKRDIINYYQIPEEKIKVIYPGLANPTSYILNPKFLRPPFILFLGTLEPRKNIAGLITAYEAAFPNLRNPHDLIIAGAPGWKNKEIKKLARRSPLHDRIKFIGFVDEGDKPALYRGASVFVYPSFYEGFGFPVLEAMQYGTAVITSNRSSLHEITSGAAYLINPHRPHEITAGLIKILNSPSLTERFSILGKEQAAKFTWEKAAKEWLSLLQ